MTEILVFPSRDYLDRLTKRRLTFEDQILLTASTHYNKTHTQAQREHQTSGPLILDHLIGVTGLEEIPVIRADLRVNKPIDRREMSLEREKDRRFTFLINFQRMVLFLFYDIFLRLKAEVHFAY